MIGQIIGAGNYDIGHIALGVNGGGIAALGVVGRRFKAEGCTGVPTPEGDLYAIDYVAHEMGHQFAGNHTFNGNRFALRLRQPQPSTSVEPGSGSTIMAYAGICRSGRPAAAQRSRTSPSAASSEIGDYVDLDAAPSATRCRASPCANFDTDGDSFTLTYNGATSGPIVRGTNYNAAGIEAAIESIAGGTETVVAFGGRRKPERRAASRSPSAVRLAGQATVARCRSPTAPGSSGFVGEIVRGGPVLQRRLEHREHRQPRAGRDDAGASTGSRCGPRSASPAAATDADDDPLTYTWEQNDDGAGSGTPLISNHKTSGPLFRQFGTAAHVTAEGTLMSPSPGENATGARPDPRLPGPGPDRRRAHERRDRPVSPPPPASGPFPQATSTATRSSCRRATGSGIDHDRTMHFRLTARDGNPVAGGVGPRRHRGEDRARGGSVPGHLAGAPGRRSTAAASSPVSWDIAGTAAPPLNVAQVTIRLSLDNGKTFPVVLAGVDAERRHRDGDAAERRGAAARGSRSRRSATSSSTSRTPTCGSTFRRHGNG